MTRRGGVTDQAADAAIAQACRLLRLPTMRERFAEFADAAAREQMTFRAFLAELLLAETDDREVRSRARRVRDANFPRDKRLDQFDFQGRIPGVVATLTCCGRDRSAGYRRCWLVRDAIVVPLSCAQVWSVAATARAEP